MIKGAIRSFLKKLFRKGNGFKSTANLLLPVNYSFDNTVEIKQNSKSLIKLGNHIQLGAYTALSTVNDNSLLKTGEHFRTRRFCTIGLFGGKLLIGDYVFFNNYCSVSCMGEITIGDGTMIGENVKMYDHNHKYEIEKGVINISPDDYTIGKISIGKNCWIGSNVTILNNVEIGDNVIIGANCLIYTSVPSNSIVKHKEELIITTANPSA